MLVLSLTPHTLAFKRPAATSRGPLAQRALWVVRAWDDADPATVGLGECGPIPGLSADDDPGFAPALHALAARINAARAPLPNPRTARDLLAWLDNVLAPWDDALAALPSFRFGLESALLDLRHGGRGLYFDSPFARGQAALPTHGLIWMDTPAGLLAQIEAKVAAGFCVIKLKVGALDFGAELALLAAVRARFPHITLRLDANGAFAPTVTAARLAALAPFGIEFLEQPIAPGQRAALAALCASSPMPLALDEELIGLRDVGALAALLDEVRPPHLVLKPALLGGWRATLAAAALCDARGITWWANSLLESSIGHAAICQWAAAQGGARVHGLGTGSLFAANFPAPIALQGSALVQRAPQISAERGAIAR